VISRRFGLLLNQNRCAYSYALAEALQAAAARRQLELELWPVPWATSAAEIGQTQVDEILSRAPSVEGLVMMSSVFSHGLKSLGKLAQAWWPRPASSIGYRLPLVPSVLVDNRGAMYAATRHLIVNHGRRSIIFIRGRIDSQEATDRYYGFRQALTDSQIIYDGARVVQGDFTRQSAVQGMNTLPSDLQFDALIASNDEMALAVLQELERSGRRVPADVSVIGFDDVPEASKAAPPLTTMAQPFDALAAQALDLASSQCDGGHAPATTQVPVNFVPRLSCGCGHRSW
jgi:DNA-binding LacI/PurR family transcriptional regulator